MDNKVKMTVEMKVTLEQAVALREMFDHMNHVADQNDGRIALEFTKGFRPQCEVITDRAMPDLVDDDLCYDQDGKTTWIFNYSSIEDAVHDFELGIADSPFKE